METEKKTRVVPKENAVFWMDNRGVWHNKHGRFEHPKIISHFNRSIGKDSQGYFVSQQIEDMEEKIYFPYEDTAVFAVNVCTGSTLDLILNTGQRLVMDPHDLFIHKDTLFLQTPEHLIQFSPQAMSQLSKIMDEADAGLALVHGETRVLISEKTPL